jgi:hypothetical protein
MVPEGPARQIQVVGMHFDSGECPSFDSILDEKVSEIQDTNFYEIASAVVDVYYDSTVTLSAATGDFKRVFGDGCDLGNAIGDPSGGNNYTPDVLEITADAIAGETVESGWREEFYGGYQGKVFVLKPQQLATFASNNGTSPYFFALGTANIGSILDTGVYTAPTLQAILMDFNALTMTDSSSSPMTGSVRIYTIATGTVGSETPIRLKLTANAGGTPVIGEPFPFKVSLQSFDQVNANATSPGIRVSFYDSTSALYYDSSVSGQCFVQTLDGSVTILQASNAAYFCYKPISNSTTGDGNYIGVTVLDNLTTVVLSDKYSY